MKEEGWKRYWWHGRLPLYVGALVAGLLADAVTPYGSAEWLIGLLMVCVAIGVGSMVEMLVVAAAVSVFVIVGLWTSGPGGVPLWLEIVNRGGCLAVIWVAVWVARRQRLAEGELRVLRGLLPICAACKKIRNESDQWESLERYISQRSEAQFTHGLCPACFERYRSEI